MKSMLRYDAYEIFVDNQEGAWLAFRDGQPYPVVVRVAPTFVPLGADAPPQRLDYQHVIRFVPGYLGGQPAYCVMVDDTPALEDYVVVPGSFEEKIWNVHAVRDVESHPPQYSTGYVRPVRDDVSCSGKAWLIEPPDPKQLRADPQRTRRAGLFAVNLSIVLLVIAVGLAVVLTWLRHR